MKKIRNILFSVVILSGIIGTIFFTVFYKEPLAVSTQENRNLSQFSDCDLKEYGQGLFQKNLENSIADQFIGRYNLVKIKKEMDNNISQMIYPVPDDELFLHKIEGVDNVYQVGNSNYLMNGLMMEDEEYKLRFSNRVKQINDLQKHYPEINIYVYKPTQIHETSLFDERNGTASYGEEYSKILRDGLEVPYAELEIADLDMYKEFFYASDHHWNYEGSYQGYLDIVKLIFGEDEKPLLPKELLTFDNKLVMQGTFAGRTGYIYDGDIFSVYTFELPEYSIYVDGTEVKDKLDMNHFKGLETLNDPSANTYYYNTAYWNYKPYSVWVNHSSPDKESLLLVGDSYAGPVLPLLLNHYSCIYFVQPTDYYDANNFDYFYYDEFIEENSVDNILFMYTVENYFYYKKYEDYEINQYDRFNIHYRKEH